MRYTDQKKYFEVLRRYERKFTPQELKEYQMLKKRHKDDEDLDKLSFEKLKALHEKYYVNRERKNFDHFFKSPKDKE